MNITAIIIDGRHGGLLFIKSYSPVIRLPIETESQISMGEKYDNSVRIGDEIEYKECFRSVDKKCVLYSTNGCWDSIEYALLERFRQTYPIKFF